MHLDMFKSTEVMRLQEKAILGELPEVLLEKLILSGQSLLTTIADLKRAALLSDFPGLNQLMKSKIEEHDEARLECEIRIQQMIADKDTQVILLAHCCKGTVVSACKWGIKQNGISTVAYGSQGLMLVI